MGVVRPPEPTPEVVMAPTGVYWRREPNGWLSMPPVSDDNDMLLTPLAVYRLVGWESVNGTLHSTRDEAENASVTGEPMENLHEQRRTAELEMDLHCVSCEASVQVLIRENTDTEVFAAHALLSEAQGKWLSQHKCPNRKKQ